MCIKGVFQYADDILLLTYLWQRSVKETLNVSCFLPLQECQNKANGGKFRLRDLLSVPMQRVLKYPLLLRVSSCIPVFLLLVTLIACYGRPA